MERNPKKERKKIKGSKSKKKNNINTDGNVGVT